MTTTPKYPGIKKVIHELKKTCEDKVHCLTENSADRPLTELRTMKQKNNGSKIGIKIKKRYKNKKSKRRK